MTPVRVFLLRHGLRTDAGRPMNLDLTDHETTARLLRHELHGAIRGDGADPALCNGRYQQEVRDLTTGERLLDVEVAP